MVLHKLIGEGNIQVRAQVKWIFGSGVDAEYSRAMLRHAPSQPPFSRTCLEADWHFAFVFITNWGRSVPVVPREHSHEVLEEDRLILSRSSIHKNLSTRKKFYV